MNPGTRCKPYKSLYYSGVKTKTLTQIHPMLGKEMKIFTHAEIADLKVRRPFRKNILKADQDVPDAEEFHFKMSR